MLVTVLSISRSVDFSSLNFCVFFFFGFLGFEVVLVEVLLEPPFADFCVSDMSLESVQVSGVRSGESPSFVESFAFFFFFFFVFEFVVFDDFVELIVDSGITESFFECILDLVCASLSESRPSFVVNFFFFFFFFVPLDFASAFVMMGLTASDGRC